MYNFVAYGSLMDHGSLKKTVSDKNFVPVIVKGYKRIFNLVDEENCDELNLVKCSGKIFNGVVFSLNEKELKKLFKRELEYNLEEVEYFDFLNGKKLGKAFVVVDLFLDLDKNKRKPNKDYFRLCRKAAYSISEEFGESWDRSTYISDGELVRDWIKKNKGFDFKIKT